jgi:hypothetical protein
MRTWRPLPGEDLRLFSPVGLRLVDDLTGQGPVGPVRARLDFQDGAAWRETDVEPVITASGVLAYPGLGRAADTTGAPVHYRVRLESPVYRPSYRATDDGIEFDAPPFNDANPPAPVTGSPVDAVLLPAAAYPFAPFLGVLRGVVEDLGGDPVPDVLVQEGLRERVLTDERGAFSLPLRWVPAGVATVINAVDHRGGRSGSINVTLPGSLAQSQTITVS